MYRSVSSDRRRDSIWPYGMTTREVDEFLEDAEWLLRQFLESGYHQTINDFLNEYDIELVEWLVNEKGREDLECRN